MAKMSYLDVLTKKGIVPSLSAGAVEAIREFDPIGQYAIINANGSVFKLLKQHKIEVGRNSNLLRDMCQFGATEEELVRAVKYGMVLIDAEKHFLDWKRSKKDFGIDELYEKYRHFN